MHRLLPLLLVLLIGGRATFGQPESVTEQFDAATGAYQEGRYARAVSGYEAILDSGFVSVALFYNLGNGYVRLDKLGDAIRYYEKARRLHPRHPSILHNLEQARRRAGVYPGRLPPRGVAGLVRDWSPVALFLAGLLLFSSGLADSVLWMGSRRRSVFRHPLVWIPGIAGALLILIALATSALQARQHRAVIVADHAPVHAAATSTSPADTTLPAGTLVEVRERNPRWHRVRLANGAVGWVPARALGDI